jgi:hypothetical protein
MSQIKDTTVSDDDAELHRLGYPRKLARRMSAFDNFGVSFTIISILSGCLTLYYFGMANGGPALITWGWVAVGGMTMLVGLAMGEVCSAFPTSGALYYYSAKLAKRRGPIASWYTGWLNALGQMAITAGIDYGAATFIGAYAALQWNFVPTQHSVLGIYAVVLVVHGLLNTFGVRLVALLNRVSVWWHLIGVLVIVGVLTFKPSHHQSASFVFTKFVNNSGFGFAGSGVYVAAVGLLMAGYTFTGYDASAHMTEETAGAAVSAPKGIVRAIYVSWIAGFVLLVGITFAIQNYSAEASSRPRAAWIDPLVPGQSAHQDADERGLAGRRGRLRAGRALVVELDRVRRGDLDRDHRPLPGLHHPGLPAAAAGRGIPARAVASRPLVGPGRLAGRGLGRVHVGDVPAAAVLADHRAHLQLRPGRARGRAGRSDGLVVRHRARHVHRTGLLRLAGGARGHGSGGGIVGCCP